MGLLSTAAGSVERSIERLSQRAFDWTQRDRPRREASARQITVKAIAEGTASESQIEEALEFRLAARDEHGVFRLTPMGEITLSRYPAEGSGHRRAPKAAAA
jgi:hypothetical protein